MSAVSDREVAVATEMEIGEYKHLAIVPVHEGDEVRRGHVGFEGDEGAVVVKSDSLAGDGLLFAEEECEALLDRNGEKR